MRPFLMPALALAALLLAACASVKYQPFEGPDALRQGSGGTHVEAHGVDFWTYGTPPRPYRILGVVSGEMSGSGADSFIRQGVAQEVRRRGGDAVLPIDSGMIEKNALYLGGTLGTTQVRQLRYVVIQYVD